MFVDNLGGRMKEKEEEFRKRLEKEQRDREYKAWKKKHDPVEIERERNKIEPFNPSKNRASFFTYLLMFLAFQAFYWLYWNKR